VDADLTAVFAALADPTRLRLLQTLAAVTDESPICVCALGRRLGVSQPAVSQHVRVLRSLGLVRAQRNGMRVHYLLDRPRVKQLQSSVQELFDLLAAEPDSSKSCVHCPTDHAQRAPAEQGRANPI
jgi:ArsR family transcriptional regulator